MRPDQSSGELSYTAAEIAVFTDEIVDRLESYDSGTGECTEQKKELVTNKLLTIFLDDTFGSTIGRMIRRAMGCAIMTAFWMLLNESKKVISYSVTPGISELRSAEGQLRRAQGFK